MTDLAAIELLLGLLILLAAPPLLAASEARVPTARVLAAGAAAAASALALPLPLPLPLTLTLALTLSLALTLLLIRLCLGNGLLGVGHGLRCGTRIRRRPHLPIEVGHAIRRLGEGC